jgi:hypothetical protein
LREEQAGGIRVVFVAFGSPENHFEDQKKPLNQEKTSDSPSMVHKWKQHERA